jgi:phage tail P2-like protein
MSTRPTDRTASLLPPQATALERDLEQATARVADVPTPFDTMWNHATCPAHLLGWLAWANSVDEWDPAWPEDVKREAIRIAPLLHQRKGTVWALQNALKPLGTTTRIEEWWAMNPPGAPGTFRATTLISRSDLAGTSTAEGPLLTPALTNKIKAVIDCNKPLSRSYGLRIGVGLQSRHREATVLRPAQHTALAAKPQTKHLLTPRLRNAAALRTAQHMTLEVQPQTRHLMTHRLRDAAALRPATHINLCMFTSP